MSIYAKDHLNNTVKHGLLLLDNDDTLKAKTTIESKKNKEEKVADKSKR